MRYTTTKLWSEYKALLLFIVLMVMFRSAVADWNDVPSGSMKPTIVAGDRILVNKLAYDIRLPLTHISLYRLADPRRGDIVVFESEAADRRLVKRVIGVPGDSVEMVDNVLVINGEVAKYSDAAPEEHAIVATEAVSGMSHAVRVHTNRTGRASSFGPVTVPSGAYLVLGDNRDESADSRYYGFVPRAEIVGRSSTVVLSLDPNKYYLPRSDRFIEPL